MRLATDEKQMLETIVAQLLAANAAWFDEERIDVCDKESYWVLDYVRGSPGKFNWLTRGLVVAKPPAGWQGTGLELIKAFPFVRFYNHQDDRHAARVDFSQIDVLEKLDGMLTGVFFPDRTATPHWHTRHMVSVCDTDMKTVVTGRSGKKWPIMSLVGEFVRKLKFTEHDRFLSHIFEFVHDATFVWTKYPPERYGLYLVGSRRLSDFTELTEDELDTTAQRLGANRPRRWSSPQTLEGLQGLLRQIVATTVDFEGFVLRERETGARVKFKDPDYVRYHYNLGELSLRSLIPKVLDNDTDDILALFPDAKPCIDEIQEKYTQYLERGIQTIKYWRDQRLDRKSLAQRLFSKHGEPDRFLAYHVLKLSQEYDNAAIARSLDQALKELAHNHGDDRRSPRGLVRLLGLRET